MFPQLSSNMISHRCRLGNTARDGRFVLAIRDSGHPHERVHLVDDFLCYIATSRASSDVKSMTELRDPRKDDLETAIIISERVPFTETERFDPHTQLH